MSVKILALPGTPAPFIPPPSDGLVAWIDGQEVHAGLSSWDVVPTWDNKSSTPDYIAPNDVNDYEPHYNAGDRSVGFDGVGNHNISAGTKNTMSFVHKTGVFDIFISFRPRNFPGITGSADGAHLFGSAEGGQGLFIGMTSEAANTAPNGGIWTVMGNGSALNANFTTSTAMVNLGQPGTLLVRGDGTQIRISNDFGATFQSQNFSNAFGTGDSDYDYSIGCINPNDADSVHFEGEYFQVMVYNKNLSAAELSQLQSFMSNRVSTITTTNWVALGDSLTEGATGAYPWPAQVSQHFFPQAVQMANKGKSGNTAAQAAVRYTAQVHDTGFIGIVIFIGINDILAGTAGATILATTTGIVNAAKADSLPIVLCTLSPCRGYVGMSDPKQTELLAYNVGIRALAGPGVTVIDPYVFMADPMNAANINPLYDYGDGLHYNTAGMTFFATQVEAAMGI